MSTTTETKKKDSSLLTQRESVGANTPSVQATHFVRLELGKRNWSQDKAADFLKACAK